MRNRVPSPPSPHALANGSQEVELAGGCPDDVAPLAQQLLAEQLPRAAALRLACASRLPLAPLLPAAGGGPGAGARAARPLLALPWAARLRRLDLGGVDWWSAPGLAPPAGLSLPLLENLSAGPAAGAGRAARGPGAGGAPAAALAACGLPALRRLALGGLAPGAAGPLLAAAWAPQLEALRLSYACSRYSPDDLPDSEAAALAAADLPALTELGLGGASPSARGWHALVAAPWAPRLRSLELWDVALGSAGRGGRRPPLPGVRALAGAALPALASLSLSSVCLGARDLGGRAEGGLARAAWFPNLVELKLAGDALGQAELKLLAKLPLRRIESLELRDAGVGGASLAALAAAPWAPRLRALRVAQACGGRAWFAAAARAAEAAAGAGGALARVPEFEYAFSFGRAPGLLACRGRPLEPLDPQEGWERLAPGGPGGGGADSSDEFECGPEDIA